MRVGILSMQRVDNYGSLWQAYCLKKMLESLGAFVEFIDIKPGYSDTINISKKTFALNKIKKTPYYVFQEIKHKRFSAWRAELLGIKPDRNYNEDYDIIIIGSDEVFNCAQKSSWGLSLQLFGNMNNENIYTYAASFGNTKIDDVKNSKYTNEIRESLQKIKKISVRDNNSYEIIHSIVETNAYIHLDPVLVGDIPHPVTVHRKKEYILVYAYDFRLQNKELIREIKLLAREERLSIISVGFYQEWADKNIIPDPNTMLSLFRNAKYIITDTFHGTIFSVRYHKQFAVIVQKENSMKLQDLIHRIGIETVQYTGEKTLKQILLSQIQYDEIDKRLQEKKKESIEYLNMCLNNCE